MPSVAWPNAGYRCPHLGCSFCALHARSDRRKDLLHVTADGAISVPTQRRGVQRFEVTLRLSPSDWLLLCWQTLQESLSEPGITVLLALGSKESAPPSNAGLRLSKFASSFPFWALLSSDKNRHLAAL